MGRDALNRANYKGVYWKDIDWSKPIHRMDRCTCCGIDGDEAIGLGHQASCYYGNGQNLSSAEGFFREEIKQALIREKKLDKYK